MAVILIDMTAILAVLGMDNPGLSDDIAWRACILIPSALVIGYLLPCFTLRQRRYSRHEIIFNLVNVGCSVSVLMVTILYVWGVDNCSNLRIFVSVSTSGAIFVTLLWFLCITSRLVNEVKTV